MWRRLLRRLALALLAFVLWSGPALAQQSGDTGEEKSTPAPALQHTVAILCTLLVLFIVCKPSRKS